MLLVWAVFIEPNLLTVTQRTFRSSKLPRELDGLRVVFFTDLHAGPRYSEAAIERVARKISKLQPDLLLFGGDFLHRQATADRLDASRISKAFAAIESPRGKYAIYGNHDVWTARTEEITQTILGNAGFVLLDNEACEIAPGFSIVGTRSHTITHYIVSRPNPQKAFSTVKEGFTLLLSHEPEQFIENAKYPFELQLSGHSHGGQVALPLIGPLLLPEGAKKYPYGEYKIGERTLFTSRGIGTSILKVRFNAPPEIVVYTLECD